MPWIVPKTKLIETQIGRELDDTRYIPCDWQVQAQPLFWQVLPFDDSDTMQLQQALAGLCIDCIKVSWRQIVNITDSLRMR